MHNVQIVNEEQPYEIVPDTYPKTWPAVAGYALWRYGILVVLLGMLVVLFYYLQKANERSQDLADKMMNCISEATATQRTTAIILTNLNEDLAKHQTWEQDVLKDMTPRVQHIEDALNRPR
jgi:hypothetical protein